MGLLERLAAGLVLGDGGYLLELEKRGYVQAGPYTPEAVLEFPEAVRGLHQEYRRAGAQVLQALTFYGSAEKLASVGRAGQHRDINQAAVRLAREVAGTDTLVAGGVTQHPAFAPHDARARRQVQRELDDQIAVQGEAGVDFIIGETFVYLEEALLALERIRYGGLIPMITMGISRDGSKDGFSPADCARRLADAGAAVVGVNCSFDPRTSLETAVAMGRACDVYLACQPIGYATPGPALPFTRLPEFPLALDPLQLTRFELAQFAQQAAEAGIRYVGGCCGVSAHHIRSMAEALGRCPVASAQSPALAAHTLPEVKRKHAPEFWAPVR